MGALLSSSLLSSSYVVGTSHENPDYSELTFRRDITRCRRLMSIIRLDQANGHVTSFPRTLVDVVRGIPPSFRKDPAYLAVADEMSRELNIQPPDPIL